MTDKSAAAIKEFAEKWCLKVIEVMKGDDYIMHDLDGCFSDLTALISEHYVSREEYKELLQQRDELKEALMGLSELFEKLHGGAIVGKTIRQRAEAAIKNTER